VKFNVQKTAAQFAAFLAATLGRDVTAMVLYRDGSALRPETVLGRNTLIEVRIKTIYDRPPPFSRECHPVMLIQDFKYIRRLFDLLTSSIGDMIYDILIQIPTPDSFKLEDAWPLDPAQRLLFVYHLHYLAKHLHERSDIADIHKALEGLLIDKFDLMAPEARYLVITLLNPLTRNEQLVLSVLPRLYSAPAPHFFTRSLRRLWAVVGDFDIAIPPKILEVILLTRKPKFRELALASKLIKSQSFTALWSVFTSGGKQMTDLPLLFAVPVVPDLYKEVFRALLPFFPTLDDSILRLFEQIASHWDAFPAEQLTPMLLDTYIYCVKEPPVVTNAPFDLLLLIMKHHPDIQTEVLNIVEGAIPSIHTWNYLPEDSFKTVSVGLNNLGATCYVNSVLQQLFRVPQFRDFMVGTLFENDTLQALHLIFMELQYSSRRSLDMHRFAAKWKGSDGQPINPREQQDAADFLLLLLGRLEKFHIGSLFAGTIESTYSNASMNFPPLVQTEKFMTLPLAVMGQHCIDDSLKLHSQPEFISDYRVEGIDHLITVESRNRITELPPYLIVQLKRFDYSIETHQRTKLDQEYEFEDVLDFRGYVSESIPETRYRLKGVIVHQGEADIGHYLSYVRDEGDTWICLNDSGVQIVATAVMRNDANGMTVGSSAYLLFYERADATSVSIPDISLISDEAGLADIRADNHRLVIDTVYISRPFANFMLSILSADGLTSVIYKYLMDVLLHSHLAGEFLKFCERLKTPDNLRSLSSFLHETRLMADVMARCSNKEIRHGFGDLITSIIANQGPEDPGLLLQLLFDVHELLPLVLDSWRVSLDFFKIFYDCATLGDPFVQHLIDCDLSTTLTNFVKDGIAGYVADRSNHITAERFCRRCDLTYVLKLLPVIQADPHVVLSRACMKWFVGNETHGKAFTEMYVKMRPDDISGLAKLIDDCPTKPSEFVFIELLKLDKFVVPSVWLSRYFGDSAKQKHLSQVFLEEVEKDTTFLVKVMTNRRPVFGYLMFSSILEVRNNCVNKLRKLAPVIPDFIRLLFQYLPDVRVHSHEMYHSIKSAIVKPETFPCLPYLQLLFDYATQCDTLAAYYPTVESTLTSLVALQTKRDEHAIIIAQIGCRMILKGVQISPEFLQGIQAIFATLAPDHQLLDSAVRSYILAVSNTTLPFTTKLPDNGFKSLLFKALLSNDGPAAKDKAIVMDFFTASGGRYAEGSKILRTLITEIAKYDSFDARAILATIAPYTNVSGVLSAHADNIGKQPKVFVKFLSLVGQIRPDEAIFPSGVVFVAALVQLASAHLKAVLTENPRLMRPFVRTVVDSSLPVEARIASVKALKAALCANPKGIEEISASYNIGKALNCPEVSEYVAELVELSVSGEFPAAKAGQELAGLARVASAAADFLPIVKAIADVNPEKIPEEFVRVVAEGEVLERLLGLTGSDATEFGGLAGLAGRILPGLGPEEKERIRSAAGGGGPLHEFIRQQMANLS
jgi:hypothetical protein